MTPVDMIPSQFSGEIFTPRPATSSATDRHVFGSLNSTTT